jgi:hypothetical protein
VSFGHVHRFCFVVELHHHDHRSEGLGLGQGRRVVDISEYRGFEEVTACELATNPLAAQGQLSCVLGDGFLDGA